MKWNRFGIGLYYIKIIALYKKNAYMRWGDMMNADGYSGIEGLKSRISIVNLERVVLGVWDAISPVLL